MSCALVRGQVRDVDALEHDAPAVRRELAGELRHQRRLAGAIGADQGMHLALPHLQVDAITRHDAAEALAQALHVEQRPSGGHRAPTSLRQAPASPLRANSTTASSTQPVQNSQCDVYAASTSCSSRSAAAPATPPHSVATPPRITITINVPDCVQCSTLGLT